MDNSRRMKGYPHQEVFSAPVFLWHLYLSCETSESFLKFTVRVRLVPVRDQTVLCITGGCFLVWGLRILCGRGVNFYFRRIVPGFEGVSSALHTGPPCKGGRRWYQLETTRKLQGNMSVHHGEDLSKDYTAFTTYRPRHVRHVLYQWKNSQCSKRINVLNFRFQSPFITRTFYDNISQADQWGSSPHSYCAIMWA